MPPSKQGVLWEVRLPLVTLLDLFCKLFLNFTFVEFGVSGFSLPDDIFEICLLPEFGKRFPALSDGGFAVELRDGLVWNFELIMSSRTLSFLDFVASSLDLSSPMKIFSLVSLSGR